MFFIRLRHETRFLQMCWDIFYEIQNDLFFAALQMLQLSQRMNSPPLSNICVDINASVEPSESKNSTYDFFMTAILNT